MQHWQLFISSRRFFNQNFAEICLWPKATHIMLHVLLKSNHFSLNGMLLGLLPESWIRQLLALKNPYGDCDGTLISTFRITLFGLHTFSYGGLKKRKKRKTSMWIIQWEGNSMNFGGNRTEAMQNKWLLHTPLGESVLVLNENERTGTLGWRSDWQNWHWKCTICTSYF